MLHEVMGADWASSGLAAFRDLQSEAAPANTSKDVDMWIKERRCPVPITANVWNSKIASLLDAIGGAALLIGARPKGDGNLGTTWTAELVVSDARHRITFRAIRGSAFEELCRLARVACAASCAESGNEGEALSAASAIGKSVAQGPPPRPLTGEAARLYTVGRDLHARYVDIATQPVANGGFGDDDIETGVICARPFFPIFVPLLP
jgi:hypothetical protein